MESMSGKPSESQAVQMARTKLGVVASLFAALQARHPPTAAHSLRVGIGMSNWGLALNMPTDDIELLEVVGLLHDLGKISLPDAILQKTSQLSESEQMIVDLHPEVGADLLRTAGADEQLLTIVKMVGYPYSEIKKSTGSSLVKLGAQMLSIMDAFDSMTTKQVYRPAFSRDRALAELFRCGSSQFNPKLVKSFAESMMRSNTDHDGRVANRWIMQLPATNQLLFNFSTTTNILNSQVHTAMDALLQSRLLGAMNEGVVFVDIAGRILEWNRMAEELTGYSRETMIHNQWTPDLLQMRDGFHLLSNENDPFQKTFLTGIQSERRLSFQHADKQVRYVDANLIPIFDKRNNLCGAAMLMQDATDQVSLEEHVEQLANKVTQDALTKVCNRAELERQLPRFVEDHLAKGEVGSLIICDIDFFKKINDTYGHPAGDEALVVFASILKQFSRDSDLVVRYGGEEFVILCPGCDIGLASDKAEAIRAELQHRPLPSLRSTSITASFGVTELQPGDSADTILARADRALLMAKENGRNRVVQIGGENSLDEPTHEGNSWLSWLGLTPTQAILKSELVASVPMDIAIEKLKGFIADHKADVLKAEGEQAILKIDCRHVPVKQREGDRPTSFLLNIKLTEVQYVSESGVSQIKTLIDFELKPVRQRDRRTQALMGQAEQVRSSFQSYLGAGRLDSKTRGKLIDVTTQTPIANGK